MIALICSLQIVVGGVFYCTGDKFDSMDDAIAIANCGLGEVVMHKLNSVRKKE